MNTVQFLKRIHYVWDQRMYLKRDERDQCLVVWDVTGEGTHYPVHKCAVGHDAPALIGIPREPQEMDILTMRKKDWSARVPHTEGEAQRIKKGYVDRYNQKYVDAEVKAREMTKEVVKPYAEWRTGVRNTLSLSPHSDTVPTGSNRKKDGRRRLEQKVAARAPH